VAAAERTESAVEEFKRSSQHLRGDLASQLVDGAPNVSNEAEQLLKFHGIYSQDNRDLRRERAQAGEVLDYSFMARVVIPGGRLSPEQWLSLDALAEDIANGSIRLTTRQAVQFHGVLKTGLRPMSRELAKRLMTTFGGCGDVVRNVVICPGILAKEPEGSLAKATDRLATTFRSRSQAYVEVFVEGELAASIESEPEIEHEFYGENYLPRKFKIGIADPGDNCIDVFAQDCGLIPGVHPEHGEGFTVIVGGGLGRSYANPDTFARLGDPLAFVPLAETEGLIAAILATYSDLGDRSDRKRARMKYVVADLGFEAFRAEVMTRYGKALHAPLPVMPDINTQDHLGWTQHANGSFQLGIRIGAGRIRDFEGGPQLRTAFREIAQNFAVVFIATPQQDLLITEIADQDRAAITAILNAHGVRDVGELGGVERNAMACPALPTCSQALTEAERRLPELVDHLEAKLSDHGLKGRRLQLRMTGCPNGCARPAVAEVGVVGRTKSSYDLYLGGGPRGTRLAHLHREKIKLEDVAEELAPLFDRWREEGKEDEGFGDFYDRVLVP
jgi:sulfite reductase (ferredoxin)